MNVLSKCHDVSYVEIKTFGDGGKIKAGLIEVSVEFILFET